MKEVVTYLTFDGNCRDAMDFYRTCLDADLELMPFSSAPIDMPKAADPTNDRIMHASLTKGTRLLMASDTMPGMPFQPGNNFSVSIQCESAEEIDRLFKAIGENGKVTMPLQDTFWGARFGMLTDQFGIQWMFNYYLPKEE